MTERTFDEDDADDALAAMRDQADAIDDELMAAAWVHAAESYHRYLIERDRLTDDI